MNTNKTNLNIVHKTLIKCKTQVTQVDGKRTCTTTTDGPSCNKTLNTTKYLDEFPYLCGFRITITVLFHDLFFSKLMP